MSKACQMLHNEKENLLTRCVTPASIKLSQGVVDPSGLLPENGVPYLGQQ